jgi:hypothetical protein
MVSAIDPTKPADGAIAVKADLRANLSAAKAEVETLQTFTETAEPRLVLADNAIQSDAAGRPIVNFRRPHVSASGLLTQEDHGGRPVFMTGPVVVPVTNGFIAEICNKTTQPKIMSPSSGDFIHEGSRKSAIVMPTLSEVEVRGDGIDVWAKGTVLPISSYTLDFRIDDPWIGFLTRALSTGQHRTVTGVWEAVAPDLPRYHHDIDGVPIGLLIEEARTNFVTHSYNLATTWTAILSGTAVLNQIGIGGLPNTASLLTDAGAGSVGRRLLFTTSGTGAVVVTWWVKKVTSPTFFPDLHERGLAGANKDVMLHTETGATNLLVGTGTVIVEDQGDWWAVSLTFTATTTSGDTRIFPATGTTFGTFAEAQGTIVVGHVQAALGGFPTSPIVTNGAIATRNADVLTFPLGSADLSDGSIIISARTGHADGTLWQLDDGTQNNLLRLYRHTNNAICFEAVAGGVQQANITGAAVADQVDFIVGASWTANAFRLVVDTVAATADTSGTVPTGLTTERLGHGIGISWWNSTIATVRREATAYTDEELGGEEPPPPPPPPPPGEFETVAFGWGAAAVGGGLNGPDVDATLREFTNLNNSGSGSLRQAVLDHVAGTGKSYIRPASTLTGIITLTSPLLISRGNLTISGREAAGNGLLLRTSTFDGNLILIDDNVLPYDAADNVVLRHLNCYHGDGFIPSAGKDVVLLGKAKHIIVDHCCVGFGTDECLSSFGASNVTISNCLVHNGLLQADHYESGAYVAHSMGSLYRWAVNDIPVEKLTLYNCAWVHCGQRIPQINAIRNTEIINITSFQVDDNSFIDFRDTGNATITPKGHWPDPTPMTIDIIESLNIANVAAEAPGTENPARLTTESALNKLCYVNNFFGWRGRVGAIASNSHVNVGGAENLFSATRVAESPIQPSHIEVVDQSDGGAAFLTWQRGTIGARAANGTLLPMQVEVLNDLEAVRAGQISAGNINVPIATTHMIYDGVESSVSGGTNFVPGGWTGLTP